MARSWWVWFCLSEDSEFSVKDAIQAFDTPAGWPDSSWAHSSPKPALVDLEARLSLDLYKIYILTKQSYLKYSLLKYYESVIDSVRFLHLQKVLYI